MNSQRPGLGAKAARTAVFALLGRVRGGTLVVTDAVERQEFGDGAGPIHNVAVNNIDMYADLIRRDGLALGERYADEWWDTDDLTAFLRFSLSNIRRTHGAGNLWARLVGPLRDLRQRPQDRDRDRNDIHAHYDLGNDFFSLILDETLMYSAAQFADSNEDLAAASRRKLASLANLGELGDGERILEIGTGWDGFAESAAQEFSSQITTTTISDEQYAFARQRLQDAGLSDRVTVLDQDYRDLGVLST